GIQAIGRYAEGCPSLGDGYARDLPTAQERMGEPSALEERKTVDVADCEVMAHVEIRTGPIRGKVVGIDERSVAAVGGIVYRMAVGVGHTQCQIADGALPSDLQGMIDRIRGVP